jgi:hypothetical protein
MSSSTRQRVGPQLQYACSAYLRHPCKYLASEREQAVKYGRSEGHGANDGVRASIWGIEATLNGQQRHCI